MPPYSFSSGVPIDKRRTEVLSHIDISIRGDVRKTYNFGYSFAQTDGSIKLHEMQECGYNSDSSARQCLPSLVLGYDGENVAVQQSTLAGVDLPLGGKDEVVQLDFDEDGRLDFVTVDNTTASNIGAVKVLLAATNFSPTQIIPSSGFGRYAIAAFDRNNDGKQGVVYLERGQDESKTYESASQSVYFSSPQSYTYQQANNLDSCRETAWGYQQQHPEREWVCTERYYSTTNFAVMDWRYYDLGRSATSLSDGALCQVESRFER